MIDVGRPRSLWVVPSPVSVVLGSVRMQAEQAVEDAALAPASGFLLFDFLPLLPMMMVCDMQV